MKTKKKTELLQKPTRTLTSTVNTGYEFLRNLERADNRTGVIIYIYYSSKVSLVYLGCVIWLKFGVRTKKNTKFNPTYPVETWFEWMTQRNNSSSLNFFDWIHHYIFRHMSSVANEWSCNARATACCCCENPLIITRSCNCLKLKWSHQEFEFHPPAKWARSIFLWKRAGSCWRDVPVRREISKKEKKNVYSSS